jgi:SnoaL-like domain
MADHAGRVDDLEAIRDLARRYCHSLDRLDQEGLRSVYWPDAVDHRIGPDPGSAWAYVDVAVDEHTRWSPSLHCLHNQLVEIDPGGATARGESYCVAYLFEATEPAMHTWFGRYLDRYEQRGDEWRISERLIVHEASRTDDPIVPMPPVPDSFRPGRFDRPSSRRPIGP